MSDTIFDIQNEIDAGMLTFTEIAAKYSVTYADVLTIYEEYMEMLLDSYDDSMDGDFDTAMASAGFGTDEDYGYISDNDYFDDF